MRQIRSKDTSPELAVRSLLHRMGFRFRIHYKKLPGKPDIVFPSRYKAIFVHGCFWHQHSGCREGRIPSTRIEYWSAKLTRTISRDAENRILLESMGWQSLVLWECELFNLENTALQLKTFLGTLRSEQ
jgi:DNA mismatch endonuclease (patch repair protein)